MDDAMDMSLDDYINSFKQSKADQKSSLNNSNRSEESKFKEGRREQDDDEVDDELTLDCQEDDYVSLALKKTDLLLDETESVEPNDLRNKLVGRFPKSSQQWRLMQPNIMNVRPAGMPPLVPSDAPQNSLNGNGNRSNWRNYNHRYRRNNSNNNNNWNNNNNQRNNQANGRIQRFNSSNKTNLNSKNIKIVLEQLKQRNPMILYSSAGTPDLTIESTINNRQNSSGFTNFSIPKIMKAETSTQSHAMLESADNSQSKGSEAIKSLLGVSEIGIRNDMMPALAGRLLDFLNGTNPTIHKPIYDMKIQKEIHEIQKKPLLYKCPGGEVVSSDGAGVPDCKIQPKVSGISLNNRFA
ncbi:putative uncharacterized protein DDB_G0289263 [Eupeodes corollae]|uniref:putative uncharacterized protein DDB_G0289263 n=1 Tax=Eupeodes corollae TaxID=290404 RepID=UPI00248F8865|nr:putative uncharacterized protein DDB_G0289263 [Eupeodes corollae]